MQPYSVVTDQVLKRNWVQILNPDTKMCTTCTVFCWSCSKWLSYSRGSREMLHWKRNREATESRRVASREGQAKRNKSMLEKYRKSTKAWEELEWQKPGWGNAGTPEAPMNLNMLRLGGDIWIMKGLLSSHVVGSHNFGKEATQAADTKWDRASIPLATIMKFSIWLAGERSMAHL